MANEELRQAALKELARRELERRGAQRQAQQPQQRPNPQGEAMGRAITGAVPMVGPIIQGANDLAGYLNKGERYADAALTGVAPAFQGATFGFGDEIVGGLGLRPQETELLRKKLAEAKRVSPIGSTAAEILGGAVAFPMGKAKRAVEQAPGAVAAIARALGSTLKGATTAGGLGAAYGFGSADGSDEKTLKENALDRLGKAVDVGVPTALLGGGISGAGSLVKTGANALVQSPIGQKIVNLMRDEAGSIAGKPNYTQAPIPVLSPEESALLSALRERGIPSDKLQQGVEALKSSAQDVPLNVMDTTADEGLYNLGKLLRAEPASTGVFNEALKARVGERAGVQHQRIIDALEPISSEIGSSGELQARARTAVQNKAQALKAERTAATQPLYEAAESKTPYIEDSALQPYLNTKWGKRIVREFQSEFPEMASEPANKVSFVQEMRSFLQGKIADAKGPKKHEYSKVYDGLTDIVEKNSPEFMEANRAYSSMSETLNKLVGNTDKRAKTKLQGLAADIYKLPADANPNKVGQMLMTKHPDQLAALKSVLGPEHEADLLATVKGYVIDKLEREVPKKTGYGDALNYFRTDANRQRLQALVGPEKWKQVEPAIDRELSMIETNQATFVGSPTYPLMKGGGMLRSTVKKVFDAITSPLQTVKKSADSYLASQDAETYRKMAEILTDRTKGIESIGRINEYLPQIEELQKAIAQYGRAGAKVTRSTAPIIEGGNN